MFQKAREDFLNYDFESAADLLEEYEAALKKAKKNPDQEFEIFSNQLNIATNAFGRVQKIVVLDSIQIPRNSFFKALKTSASAGSVGYIPSFNLKKPDLKSNDVAFLSEGRDYLIAPVANSDGELHLWESYKLGDGTWESHEIFSNEMTTTGDYAFPFMSGDGQTLYFANNGDDSMGGFDLFVVQKEPITGKTLQPLNLGMPFNSPYDDFMLVVDEEKGLAWLATDRNSPGGDVTLYLYLLDDIRQNYPADTENLSELAKISNYRLTWEEGKEKEYQQILNNLK